MDSSWRNSAWAGAEEADALLLIVDAADLTANANSPGARGKEQGLNENYAREIMELHTLGVDGGYTQDDVIALAHPILRHRMALNFSARAEGASIRQVIDGLCQAYL